MLVPETPVVQAWEKRRGARGTSVRFVVDGYVPLAGSDRLRLRWTREQFDRFAEASASDSEVVRGLPLLQDCRLLIAQQGRVFLDVDLDGPLISSGSVLEFEDSRDLLSQLKTSD